MRTPLPWLVFAVVSGAVVACSGEPHPAVVAPVAVTSASASASSATAPSASPSSVVVDANPTERTEAERARDAGRAPLANAILDAYTNFDPDLTRDGQHVVFGSRRDGNKELYLGDVAHPDAPPVALTHGPERAYGAIFSRDGTSIYFSRDTGADENDRLYRVGLDGKDETCLTPGPVLRRSSPIEPRSRPGTLVYTQREGKAVGSQVVVHELGHDPKVVYTDETKAFVRSVTADGARALLLRRYSSSDFVLFDLDLRSGKKRRLYPAEGTKSAIHSAHYSIDGRRAFVAADDGAAGQMLFAIDTTTGAVTAKLRQTEPPTAFLENVVVSPKGDRLGVVVDMGDHGEARILDAKTLAVVTKVAAPLGWIGLGQFTADGKRIAATITTADAPTDIFVVDVAKGTATPLRADVRKGLEALEPLDASIETTPAFDGLSLHLVTNLPKGARASGKRLPVIVAFHGGPADSAVLSWDPFARFFTALGYAYVEPNVRGSTGYGRAFEMADDREKRADWLADVATVNAWAKAQPWADPTRIIAMGGSYGGYSVLMALTRQPTLWRAGVDYAGIANLITFLQTTDRSLRAVWIDEFGDLDKDRALLEEFSPLRDVDEIVAPLYVYAGQNDPRVPREEADQVVLALRRRGVPVEYQVAANEGHSLDRRETRVEFLTRVARFLEDHAK